MKIFTALIDCADGQLADTVPESENEFVDYCVLFSNDDKMVEYDGVGADSAQLLKMTVDTFILCLIRQKFPIV